VERTHQDTIDEFYAWGVQFHINSRRAPGPRTNRILLPILRYEAWEARAPVPHILTISHMPWLGVCD